MKYNTLFVCMLFFIVPNKKLYSQSGCQNILKKATKSFQNNQLENALRQLQDAETCDYKNELVKKRQALQKKIFKAVNDAKRLAVTGQKTAEAALIEAEKATIAAETAKQEADKNAKISEARRLSSLADIEKNKGNYSDALYLAYEALKAMNSIGEQIDQVNLAFGDAVYHSQKKTLSTHKDKITLLKYAPNGTSMFSCGRDSTLQLWNSEGKLIQKINAQQGLILAAVYSDNSQFILTCGANGTAKIWNIKGKLVKSYTGHQAHVLGGVFSKDGSKVLTWSRDNTAKLWSTTGQDLATFKHDGNVFAAQFSPDETRILTRSADQTVKLWNSNGAVITKMDDAQKYIYQASFSPDGQTILTSSANNRAILWDLLGKQLVILPHQGIVKKTVFSKDGTKILSVGLDNLVNVWSNTGKLLMPLVHTDLINTAEFSSNGRYVITSSNNQRGTIWDLENNGQQLLLTHEQAVLSTQLNPGASHILTYTSDNTGKLWDMKGTLLMTFPHQAATTPTFTTDGKAIIAAADGLRLEYIPLPTIIAQSLITKKLPVLSPEKITRYGLATATK